MDVFKRYAKEAAERLVDYGVFNSENANDFLMGEGTYTLSSLERAKLIRLLMSIKMMPTVDPREAEYEEAKREGELAWEAAKKEATRVRKNYMARARRGAV